MVKHIAVPRKSPVRSQTSIVDGQLYFEDVRQCAVEDDAFREIIEYEKSIRVVSLDFSWEQRVWIGDQIVRESIDCEMTLRSEKRSGRLYWYAYRRAHGTLFKRFVGASEDINNRKLVDVAKKLPTTHH